MREIITSDNESPRRARPLYRSSQIVWYIFEFIEFLLLFRFILRLLGANPNAGFTQLIYGATYPLVLPFLYVFPRASLFSSVLEWGTLLAMVVYWLLAWGIVRLIVMNKPISAQEADEKLRDLDMNR